MVPTCWHSRTKPEELRAGWNRLWGDPDFNDRWTGSPGHGSSIGTQGNRILDLRSVPVSVEHPSLKPRQQNERQIPEFRISEGGGLKHRATGRERLDSGRISQLKLNLPSHTSLAAAQGRTEKSQGTWRMRFALHLPLPQRTCSAFGLILSILFIHVAFLFRKWNMDRQDGQDARHRTM